MRLKKTWLMSLSLGLSAGLLACKAEPAKDKAPAADKAAKPAAGPSKPGDGVTVRPGRATWNTGYFQEALVRRALTELGYKVEPAKELQNPLFYKSLALGDLDYWANGWFPMHDDQLPKNFDEKAEKIGYVIKNGGLLGYLATKELVEKYNIKSLDDFKRPEVKKAFDANGDGKADLVGAPPGWGGYKIIMAHMKAYKLDKHINLITAAYEAGMASALGRFKSGKPVFFWTWAPNWTIHKMKPGKDVMWINVPKIVPTPAQEPLKDRMTQTGVVGAVSDPIKLGFVVSDVRMVARKEFLAKNPAAKRFFELFKVKLEDVNAQNTKMNDGEKSDEDIKKHVDAWVTANQATWDGWLKEARAAAQAK